jgi:hypothetical protein
MKKTFGLLSICFLLFSCDLHKVSSTQTKVSSTVTSVIVSPVNVAVEILKTQQFTVEVQGTDSFDSSVNWFVNDIRAGDNTVGTISWMGLYTAPSTIPDPSTVIVKAVSAQDSTKFGTASVTITGLSQPRLEWVRTMDFGSTLADRGYAVAIDSQHNIIVGGIKRLRTYAPPGTPIPPPIGVLLSYDSEGNERWVLDFGDTPSEVLGIEASSNLQDFFFTGSPDTFCGKISNLGQILIDPFIHPVQVGGYPLAIRRQDDELYLAVFGTGRIPWLIKTDLSFNLIESFQLREEGRPRGLWVTPNHILITADFYDSEGNWNIASFIKKLDIAGNLLWEKIFDDVVNLYVVEDSEGYIYVAGAQLPPPPNPDTPYVQKLFIAQLDQNGDETWRVFWDGDNPGPYNYDNWAQDLILNPSGGVVLIAQIVELPGNPYSTDWGYDFGIWAVNSEGQTSWTIRQDFNQSIFDIPEAAIFDGPGVLIVVGGIISNPSSAITGTGADNDIAVVKFRIPLNKSVSYDK